MLDVDIECFSQRQDYKVLVRCFTYNQAEYITDTLNGFTMQQTDFPFVCIVMDDCSTDGEQSIINSYLSDNFYMEKSEKYETDYASIIIANHKTNNNCTIVVYFFKYNHYSKKKLKGSYLSKWREHCIYEALCEGDDYWTNPLKLQKQVDILESDETLIACCTNCSVVDVKGSVIEEKRILPVVRDNKSGRYSLRDFFDQSHQYPTLSVVYRNTHQYEVRQKTATMRNPYMGDWTLWIALLCFGDMYYLDEVTCAYRINPQSLTHDQSKMNQRRLGQAQDNFRLIPLVASVLPDEYKDIKKRLTKETAWMWFNLANAHKHLHHYIKMVGCLVMCGLKDPRLLCSKIMQRNK